MLGCALAVFRFSLLATVIIVPQTLTLRGPEPVQYAAAVLWTAVLELFVGFCVGYMLSRGLIVSCKRWQALMALAVRLLHTGRSVWCSSVLRAVH